MESLVGDQENQKLIPLSKGKFAIVDAVDFDSLIRNSWHVSSNGYARGYVRRDGKKLFVYMHRFILGAPKGMCADHRNSNKLDNRRSNLRVTTYNGNSQNQRMKRNNTSGFKGVSFAKNYGKYKAAICIRSKHYNLGLFKTPEEAYAVYCEAATRLHGEFARLA